jgi:methionine-rich copper-binding protein CopC
MNSLFAIILAIGSFYHTALKASNPAKGAVVAAPTLVSLTFTEKVNAALSSISVLKADSTEVEKLVVKPTTNPARIEGAVRMKLAPAQYIIRWKTVSADGHVVRNVFAFTVKPST